MHVNKLVLFAATIAAILVPAGAANRCATFREPVAGRDFTGALQSAILRCAAHGGGRVTLKPGTYTIYPMRMASKVELHLEKGALLQGSPDQSRYKPAYINWPYQADEALISASHVHHVAITGEGTIDGSGQGWWQEARTRRWKSAPQHSSIPSSNGMPRPWLIETWQAQQVTISGIHIRNAPMWNIVLRYTDGAHIDAVTIENPADAPNTDGVDVVSSRNVLIENSQISTGDDNIALKSGLPGSPLQPEPTAHVTIRNMMMGTGHGLSIGSETIFGIMDVSASHIRFDGTGNGIRIKTARDRGNRLEDFRFDHIDFRNVGTAIQISAYYPSIPDDDTEKPVPQTTPHISHITIRDVTGVNVKKAITIAGLPEAPIDAIEMRNVDIEADQLIRSRHAHVTSANVNLHKPSDHPTEGKPAQPAD